MIPRTASHVESLFELYLAAEALSHDERAAFLDSRRLSPADRSLIDGMFASAAASVQVDEWLAGDPPAEPPALPPGSEIGVYRIERLLDGGGQGSVYLASHTRAQVDRQVAVKLPRRLAGESLLGIGREARMLARLDHPAIARFLSVDHMADGRVFLVMEYVDGEPFDTALREATIDRVLTVFAELGDALNHAHQQGIAHLDLKPSNIFVDKAGQPKILDFGLGLLYTREAPTGAAPGFTRTYAAPEQLAGEGSAACDTYTLGLLLAQRLTGAAPDELRRHLSTPGPGRHPRLANLGRDLSAIVHRACADDPRRRYSSIAQFAADLRAVGARQPVGARRWTWRYALACLVRRRPWAVAAAAAAVLALSISGAALVVQRTRLVEAQAQAVRDAERSRVALGLVVSAMEAAEPESTQQITPAERAMVERLRLAAAKAADPTIRATADLVVARIARSTGDSETALALLGRVVGQAQQAGDVDILADALIVQADAYAELARFDEADAALARLHALPGGYGRRADVLRAEGRRLLRAGKYDDGEATLRQALAATQDDPMRVRLMNDLGTILNDRGRNADALALFEAQQPLVGAVFGPMSVPSGVNAHNRAISYYGLTRLDDARRAIREAEEIFTQRLGADSLRNADALSVESIIVLNDDSARAIECLGRAAAIYRAAYGADHPKLVQVLYTLGQLHLDDGDAAKAMQEFDEASVIAAARVPAGHPLVAALATGRGLAQLALDRPAAAVPLLESALALFRTLNAGPDAPKAEVQNGLSQAYRRLGRAADSEAASRAAYDFAAASLPAGSIERALFVMERAASLATAGRAAEAQALLGEARAAFDAQSARPAARKALPRLKAIEKFIGQRAAAPRTRDTPV